MRAASWKHLTLCGLLWLLAHLDSVYLVGMNEEDWYL